METQTSAGPRKRKPKQRVDGGQEVAKNVTVINDSMQKLLNLQRAAKDASSDLSEAIKKTAEKSGYLSSVIRRLVTAKAGDDFAEAKRIVDQLGEVFELEG